MPDNSANPYKMRLRSYTSTQKKAAAKLAGLRSKGQNRLGDISGAALPANVSKQPQKVNLSGSFSDPEDVDMDSSGDSDNVADDDDKMAPSPISQKASRAADKAPRKSGGARRKVPQAPATPTKGGPSRIVHSTPRKRRQPPNPPKVSISSSTVLSTPTRLPHPARLNVQISTKPRDLPIYPGTPSPERMPVPQMHPTVVYATLFDTSAIQARELEKLKKQREQINENVRLAQDMLEKNPEVFGREESGHSGSRIQRFGSHGTELYDSD